MTKELKLLSDYYDKVYVVSVKAAETRRKLFDERFQGLNYSYFYGADKNNFTIDELVEKNIYSKELTKKIIAMTS